MVNIGRDLTCFTGGIKEDNRFRRFKEYENLKQYLQYLKEKENYDVIQETAIKDLNVLREKHVEAKVREFKESEALERETRTWQWSALFLALSQNPVPNGPQRPWAHTQDEWQQIAAAVKDDCAGGPLTLDGECPHIIRALKLFSRVT
jgi:hypothetical protein